MNAATATLSRESICATCLSQDRKLFPVNDSKSKILYLNLSERDKICWECNHFVRKMLAFRSRAAKAQSLLTSALRGHPHVTKIISLSRLTCTPVYLDIGIQTADPLQIYQIKTENIKQEIEIIIDECSVENAGSSLTLDSEEMGDEMLPVSNEPREAKNDEAFFGDASDDEPVLTVLSKQSEAKNKTVVSNQKVKGDDDATGDLANASLKSLLSRKSILIQNPPSARKLKDVTITEAKGVKEVKEKMVTEVQVDNPTTDSGSMYTETIMNEEEMLLWRERKKNLAYYATNNPALRCEQCIEPFRNKILSAAHARRHSEPYGAFACRVCGVRSLSSSALAAHTAQHYRLLTCKLCAHEWDSPNGMRWHGSAAHGAPVTEWDCDQCERKYATQEQLKRHVVAHRQAACRVCGARVAATNMSMHLESHKGVVACAACERQCKGPKALAIHMKIHDTKVDEAAFCAECNMQFRTIYAYRSHLRFTLKHARTDDMPFKCGECGKAFLQQFSLTTHIDSAHSAEKKYACPDCGQMFKTRTMKNYHVRRDHKGVRSKNYICNYCGKALTTKPSLMHHINTHTGARPYACALCDATFGHKSALYLHGRYKHKIKKKSEQKAGESSHAEKST